LSLTQILAEKTVFVQALVLFSKLLDIDDDYENRFPENAHILP